MRHLTAYFTIHCQISTIHCLCHPVPKKSGDVRGLKQITLYRDELEALKLCDYEGLFQEQAGKKMGVSRGTVQRILTSARRKTAEALSSGAALVFGDDEE